MFPEDFADRGILFQLFHPREPMKGSSAARRQARVRARSAAKTAKRTEVRARRLMGIQARQRLAGSYGAADHSGRRRNAVSAIAAAAIAAAIAKLPEKLPAASAATPATAGPMICPTPKKKVIVPNPATACSAPM